MMHDDDELFRTAVAAIDAGDVAALERLLDDHPALACQRLEAPGPWLRDTVGSALDGFFQRPYLLWFVAEDPVRNGSLPPTIAAVAEAIIGAARRTGAGSVQEQLDYALRLVAWSWIARQSNVQIDLIDVLLDAGASPADAPACALVNGNVAAAAHLVARGAPMTLATARYLERWDDADRMAATATGEEKQFALTLLALRGQLGALRHIIGMGVDVNTPSPDLYAHPTPLHHAVSSGSLGAVTALVDAGAALDAKDSAYSGTPLDWAEHLRHADIAAYLRGKGAP